MLIPGKAARPLPLTLLARYTPRRSTATVPRELVQSRQSLTFCLQQSASSPERSFRIPVDVSQCTDQSQVISGDSSRIDSTARRSYSPPQLQRTTSNASPILLA